MVSYTKWVSIVFEVADNDVEATSVIDWAAAKWNQEKAGLKAATVSEAREWARSQI